MFRVINEAKLFSLHFEDPGGAVCRVEKIRYSLDRKDIVLALKAKDPFFDEMRVSLRELAKNEKWKIEGKPAGIYFEGVYHRLQNEIVKKSKELWAHYNNQRSIFVYWPPLKPPDWINPQILTYLSDETPRDFRKKLQEMLQEDRKHWAYEEEDIGGWRNEVWSKLCLYLTKRKNDDVLRN